MSSCPYLLRHPYILGGGGGQTKGDKISRTPAFSGGGARGLSRVQWLRVLVVACAAPPGGTTGVGSSPRLSWIPKEDPEIKAGGSGGHSACTGRGTRAIVLHRRDEGAGAEKRADMLRHPCILRGPQTKGDKIRIGCLTPAFLGAEKRAEMLCHPCILGGPQTRGHTQKSKRTLGATMMPLDLKVWVFGTAKRPNSCTARALR